MVTDQPLSTMTLIVNNKVVCSGLMLVLDHVTVRFGLVGAAFVVPYVLGLAGVALLAIGAGGLGWSVRLGAGVRSDEPLRD